MQGSRLTLIQEGMDKVNANRERQKMNARAKRAANPEKYSEIKKRSDDRHREKRRASSLQFKHKYWPKYILGHARRRAELAGIPFDLKPEDIICPEFCPVLGIPLFLTDGRKTDNSPSLDRIRSDLGYTKSNVRVISFRANRIKNNSRPEELRRIADWVEKELALLATCPTAGSTEIIS